jgi:hypothetical protein
MQQFSNKEIEENEQNIYECLSCDYKCSKKFNLDRHLLSSKHLKATNCNIVSEQNEQNEQKVNNVYSCEHCGKNYMERTGLWRHKKKCVAPPVAHKQDISSDLITMLIKDHADFKEMLMKVVEVGTHNTNMNNNNNVQHTNSHNKAFNLQFFLNETCKNAMNITDFVDSIKLQLSDLMEIGEKGYVESISKIIVNSLNNLDETERPIHCTDKKRETFYVKDKGQWEKEDDNRKRLKKVINCISNKYFKLLPQYRAKYPDYRYASSSHSDEHSKIVIEVMVCDNEKDDKIIRNVSKATIIQAK